MRPALATRAFVGLSALLLPTMIAASFDFGVTWDEWERHHNGVNVWAFIRGLRPRTAFAETGGHLYPGFFDTICVALESWVPVNRWALRHIVNAIFGWVGIVYTGRLAGRLFGPWCGLLAVVLLTLSPRFFAHSMNNPKDAPFAALAMMALYYISTVSPRWPYISFSTGTKITIALALALNVRAGALLYLGYFGLLVAAYVLFERTTDWRRLADTAVRVTVVAAATLVLGTLFWPWAGAAPFTRPVQALLGVSSYPWDGFVLYRMFEYSGDNLPWHYLPWWLLISSPPVVLIGGFCSLLLLVNRGTGWPAAGLWVVALFPLAAAWVRGSTAYDGIRHFLFMQPILVVLAAAGWTNVHSRARIPWQRRTVIAVLALLVLSAAVFMIRFHPNQVVYFNALVGGPRGAFLRYDMDYWGNCMLQAVRWTADVARSSDIPIRVSGTPAHLVELNAERYPDVTFVPANRRQHHFEIILMRGTRPGLRDLLRKPAVHRIRTPDGAVLCTIAAGPAYTEISPFPSERGVAQTRPRVFRE